MLSIVGLNLSDRAFLAGDAQAILGEHLLNRAHPQLIEGLGLLELPLLSAALVTRLGLHQRGRSDKRVPDLADAAEAERRGLGNGRLRMQMRNARCLDPERRLFKARFSFLQQVAVVLGRILLLAELRLRQRYAGRRLGHTQVLELHSRARHPQILPGPEEPILFGVALFERG